MKYYLRRKNALVRPNDCIARYWPSRNDAQTAAMHNWTGACHREKRAGDVCLAKGVAHENQKPRCTRNSLDAQSTSTRACMPLNRRCPLTVNWGKPFRGNTCVVCRVASRSMIRSPKQRKEGVANSCMHTTKHRTQPFPGEKMPAGVNSSMGSRTQRNHGVTTFYARTHALPQASEIALSKIHASTIRSLARSFNASHGAAELMW